MQVAIITGEASGDRVGGQLAGEIRRLRPDVVLWGTGGSHLRAAGVEVVVESSGWGVIGVVSALRLMPRIIAARRLVHREVLRRRPDILIPIDAGAFNLGFAGLEGLAPWVRRNLPQTKVLYYFPPGSWRQTLRGTSLDRNADAVATPFPWSADELRRLGANATFVGHPLLDLVHPNMPADDFAVRYHLDRERPIVGLLPGSRAQEIAQILPRQLAAAAIIHRRVPGVQFVLGLAPTVRRDDVLHYLRQQQARQEQARRQKRVVPPTGKSRREIPMRPLVTAEGQILPPDEAARRQREWAPRQVALAAVGDGNFPLVIVEDAIYDMIAASDVLLETSGTVTLETAILGKPMVIVYRMSQWNVPQYLIVRKSLPPFIGMPNLLAERGICPELIQDAATPEAMAAEIIRLLLEPERMLQMRRDLRDAVSLLGEPGGARRTAEMVVALTEQAEANAPEPNGNERISRNGHHGK